MTPPPLDPHARKSTTAIEEEFASYDGVYKLAAERSPQVREAPVPGYTGTAFSWAPALPGGGGSDTAAPYSDAGFLVYNIGDNLLFADQRAASGESEPEAVRLRARPTCHDMHWSGSDRVGSGTVSASAQGGGGSGVVSAELELLVGFLSGEVVLWRPLQKRDPTRSGASPWSKCPPWQRPSSPPAPPQRTPGGSGQSGLPRARPSHLASRHRLGGSSELPQNLTTFDYLF